MVDELLLTMEVSNFNGLYACNVYEIGEHRARSTGFGNRAVMSREIKGSPTV